MLNSADQYRTCACDNATHIPPIISGCPICCKPLKRPKLLFDEGLTGDDMQTIVCVAKCGLDVKAPHLRDDECIEFERVLNPCEGEDEFEPIYQCCSCCPVSLNCPEETVHLPGACEDGVCLKYRIIYLGDSTTKTYLYPPTTESALQSRECQSCN